MFKLGIGGGIGSGKTMVCSILRVLGVPVYNADAEARRLMDEREDLQREILQILGDAAYSNGKLDRNYVAGRVFKEGDLLKQLNRIVHPAVREDFLYWAANQSGAPYVVEEAAILFESGAYRYMDATVFVEAPLELRVSRVMERDGVSRQSVLERIARQADPETLVSQADHVIVNDGQRMLLPRVVEIHEGIKNR
jgi:dephospho-CoA kinase